VGWGLCLAFFYGSNLGGVDSEFLFFVGGQADLR